MTTPQQPDDDLKVKPEVIEDLDPPADISEQVAGGVDVGTASLNCK